MTTWSRRFQDPIPTPDGSTIRTIGQAAEYAISRPKKVRDTEPWQRAAKVLEHGGSGYPHVRRLRSATGREDGGLACWRFGSRSAEGIDRRKAVQWLLTDASVVRKALAISEVGFPPSFRLKSFWSSSDVQYLVMPDNSLRALKFKTTGRRKQEDFSGSPEGPEAG